RRARPAAPRQVHAARELDAPAHRLAVLARHVYLDPHVRVGPLHVGDDAGDLDRARLVEHRERMVGGGGHAEEEAGTEGDETRGDPGHWSYSHVALLRNMPHPGPSENAGAPRRLPPARRRPMTSSV